MRCIVVAYVLATACGRINFDPRSDGGDGGANGLVIDPPSATINTGSVQQFTATGGTPPYTFTVLGDGHVDAAAGLFIAPGHVGTSQVRVTDTASATATGTVVYTGARVYVAGGIIGATATAQVYSSADGITWDPSGMLPAARGDGSLVVFEDRLLYIGGQNTGGVPQTTIYASTNGTSWSMVGDVPMRIESTAVTVHAGAIWMVSGYEGGFDHTTVWRSIDGTTWTTVTSTFPTPRHEADVISRDAQLFVLGGHGTAQFSDVLVSSDGANWTTSPGPLSFVTDFQGAGQLGDRVVRACGQGCNLVETSTDLMNWNAATLPGGGRTGPCVFALANHLMIAGGGATTVLQSDDGAVWTGIGSLPVTNLNRPACAVFTPP